VPTHRPDLDSPSQPVPAEGPADPTGVVATGPIVAVLVLVGGIVACVALGGWPGFGGALALMVIGVLVVVRFMARLAWTRRSPERPRAALGAVTEDLAVAHDEASELSPVDVPPDMPLYRELMRRRLPAGRCRPTSQTAASTGDAPRPTARAPREDRPAR